MNLSKFTHFKREYYVIASFNWKLWIKTSVFHVLLKGVIYVGPLFNPVKYRVRGQMELPLPPKVEYSRIPLIKPPLLRPLGS